MSKKVMVVALTIQVIIARFFMILTMEVKRIMSFIKRPILNKVSQTKGINNNNHKVSQDKTNMRNPWEAINHNQDNLGSNSSQACIPSNQDSSNPVLKCSQVSNKWLVHQQILPNFSNLCKCHNNQLCLHSKTRE